MSGPLDFDGPSPDDEERRRRLERREDPDQREERLTGRRPPGSTPRRSSAWVGRITILLGFLVLVALALNELSDDDVAPGPAVGTVLPDFAAPLATSQLEGAVNLLRTRTNGRKRACEVRGADVLNVCELREKGPVVVAFLAAEAKECIRSVDALARLAPKHPDVQVAVVALRGDRGDVRELIRTHRWPFRVGYDEEGYLASVYGVAVCPQITFARKGGRIVDTTFGELSETELDAQLGNLSRGG